MWRRLVTRFMLDSRRCLALRYYLAEATAELAGKEFGVKRALLSILLMVLLAPDASGGLIVDLYKPARADLTGVGGLWNVSFTPLTDVEVTGLGIVFDPIEANVIPSLFLSLWQDDATTTNDNRLLLIAPRINEDFVDMGLDHYLFRMVDYPDYGPPPVVVLEAGRTYVLLAQININGYWPLQRTETQEIPFTTLDGTVLVTGGGPGTARSFPNFPPLFIEANPIPEPPSLMTWCFLVIFGVAFACKTGRLRDRNKLTCCLGLNTI